MSPIHAIAQGIRTINRAKRMWLVYWIATTVFALVFALPVAALVSSTLGHSIWADRLAGEFDTQFAMELISATPGEIVSAIIPAALALAAAFVLLGTFLAGGAIAVFASEERAYSPGAFWGGCGRNFARLFRVALISLGFYIVVLALNAGLMRIGQLIWGEGMEEHPLVYYSRFRMGLIALLLVLVNMIFDYAKIRLVVRDSRRTWRAAFGSVAFVFRNFGRTAGTYLGVLALAAALLGVYTLLRTVLGGWVAPAIIVAQLYVLSRIWIKLLFYASQTEIYAAIAPQPQPIEMPVPAAAEPVAAAPVAEPEASAPGAPLDHTSTGAAADAPGGTL